MQVLSYNLNGIRSAINKDFYGFLAQNAFDIICIQETKAEKSQVDLVPLAALGYVDFWHSAEKKGYSGTAIFSKKEPDRVVVGCGIEKYDFEGRVLRADFGDLTILSCYFPSGTSGDERQAFKYEFLKDFFDFAHELKKERPNLLICGDYNIAHTEIDIHNPKSNKNTSGFLPAEREWMTRWFESGFTDVFRAVEPSLVEYSWWSTRFQSRSKNLGWRIDYQSVCGPISEKIKASRHLMSDVHSDHCGVWAEYDWVL